MIDRAWAERFAREWAASWNRRDVEAVLAHFSDDVFFHSPLISKILGEDRISVSGLPALRDYWTKALAAAGALHFEILQVGVGGDAITIRYRNQRGQEVAETLVFDDEGKVSEGIVTHF